MDKKIFEPVRTMVAVFAVITGAVIAGKSWLTGKGVNHEVLIIGNLLLFAVSLFSFFITRRSFDNPNPNVFVRAMYSSFIIKFFVVAIAAFVYIQTAGKAVNKPALVGCAGLYILYTGLETRALVKLLRNKKNA